MCARAAVHGRRVDKMCIRDSCCVLRRYIAFPILAGLDLIEVIPHPMGMGLRKQIVHGAVPLNS